MHGFGVSPRAYPRTNGFTTARTNSSRRSSVTCGSPRRWQVSRAATTALGEQHARSESGPCGIEPEPQRHPDRVRAGLQQGDGAVDAAAHRDGDAALVGGRAKRRRERVRKRVGCEQLPADRRRLEQGQTAQVTVEARRLGVDDQVVLDPQAHERPVLTPRRVAVELHRGQGTPGTM